MSFTLGNVIAGIVFGGCGLFFLRVAKSEGNLRALAVGISLCAFPYFVENAYLCWAIGICLTIFGYLQLDQIG